MHHPALRFSVRKGRSGGCEQRGSAEEGGVARWHGHPGEWRTGCGTRTVATSVPVLGRFGSLHRAKHVGVVANTLRYCCFILIITVQSAIITVDL